MKKFIWVITLILVFLSTVGCSNNYTDESIIEEELEPVELSYDEIIQNEYATKGELLNIMRANTDYTNNDGSYIFLNFNSIKKVGTFTTNINDKLENVIQIENVPYIEETRNFLEGPGYIAIIDDYGNEIYPDIWTQTGSEFTDILLPIENIEDYENAKYLKLGGLDRALNKDKSVTIFEID